MNLQEYVKKVEWLCIDYDWMYWHQCVDLIKHFSQNVLNFKLWSFWWSAKSWWKNILNTFPAEKFQKIINTPKAIPEPWDITFFNIWEYWHVAIVLDADLQKIKVLEQNVGNWDWQGQDDWVKIWNYDYKNVLGWYHYIKQPIDISETQKILDEAKNLWIWNWKDWDKPASRAEVALMIMKMKELLGK